jgi:lipopolysaccharide exporter
MAMTGNVRNKMARGAIWMLSFKLVDRGVGLASTLILARILLPRDFGVIAMATSFIAMLELLGAFGFDTALIQRQGATSAHFDTAWTFNVIVASIIGVLMIALAIPTAAFFNQPTLAPVICILAVGSVFQGFENIGIVAFRKDMDFRRDFQFLSAKKLMPFPITIVLALWLRNYWALVIAMLIGRIFGVWMSYRIHPYRPKFTLSAAGDLLHFSKWLLVVNFLGFLDARLSDFVLGRTAGPRALGLFNMAYELANMPGTELVAPINRAVYPAYARIAGDLPALQREYLYVMGMISLLAVPAVAGIAATATLIVPVVLGPNWLEATATLQLLAFYGITQVVQSNAYSVYLALGRADLFARVKTLHVITLGIALISLTPAHGLIGAAIARLLTAAIMIPIALTVILNSLQLPVTRLLGALWRPIGASIVLFLVVNAFCLTAAGDRATVELLTRLLLAIPLGIAIYVLTIAMLWVAAGRPVGAESSALNAARQLWDRVANNGASST